MRKEAPTELDAAALQQYPPHERLQKLIGLTAQAAVLLGDSFEDAANIVMSLKLRADRREIDVCRGEDVEIIREDIDAAVAGGSLSGPEAMEEVKNIYLRFRNRAFPPGDR